MWKQHCLYWCSCKYVPLESVINIWVPIFLTALIETLLMFGERRDWCRPQKHVPTVKRGRGSIRLWVCFSPSGTGNLVKVEGIIKKDTHVIVWKEKIKQPNLDLSNRFVTFSFVWKRLRLICLWVYIGANVGPLHSYIPVKRHFDVQSLLLY